MIYFHSSTFLRATVKEAVLFPLYVCATSWQELDDCGNCFLKVPEAEKSDESPL